VAAFGSFRPGKHIITDVLGRHEPRVGGFADGGNEWNRSDWYSGTRGDTHCGGRAWAADLHYAAGRAVRIFDRYRRAMFLVNLAERRDGARYAWVAKLRPDLVFAAPVSPGDVFGASNVAVRGDWFNVFERDAATAGLVDGALRYWRCAGVTGLPGKTTVNPRAGKGCEIPNFKGSYNPPFPLVSADFWTSDHPSERSRRVDFFLERARGEHSH
jgi:hypothetical protein